MACFFTLRSAFKMNPKMQLAFLLCSVCAGLASASQQLPVVGDSKVQSEAQMLLDACQAAEADAWMLPLALLLEDISSLAGVRMISCLHACKVFS